MNITVKIELRQPITGMLHKPSEYADKAIVTNGKDILEFSRLSDETQWYCDALYKDGWNPIFVHGFGSRCCIKQTADEPILKAVEAAYKIAVENDAKERQPNGKC